MHICIICVVFLTWVVVQMGGIPTGGEGGGASARAFRFALKMLFPIFLQGCTPFR